MPRKLSLKRDVLQELTTDDLTGVVGGTFETAYSCMTYISCAIPFCLPTVRLCIEVETEACA